jgi:hypothetical protein
LFIRPGLTLGYVWFYPYVNFVMLFLGMSPLLCGIDIL